MEQAVSFRTRRIRSLTVTAAALLSVVGFVGIQELRLARPAQWSGPILLGSILILALLGVRRRLPVLRLGSVSRWTQIHLYTGLFCAGVYLLHVPTILADGIFEGSLAVVFLLVTFSGGYGIYASRTYPPRLTALAGQYRFDQMQWHRGEIATSAARVLDQVEEPTSAAVLRSHYESVLAAYFNQPPSLAYRVVPSGQQRRRLVRGLVELDRYLDPAAKQLASRWAALVRRRDDLDYQQALQFRLRLWVVIHSLLSMLLVAGGCVHALIAWRFTH